MATVIDALLVTLGLDSKDFGKGINEAKNAQKSLSDQLKRESKERGQIDSKAAQAQKKRVDEIHAQAKRTAEGFRKIRNEALAMAAVFTGGLGLVEFAKYAIDSQANLGQLAQTFGMSVKQIAGLQDVAKAFDGSAGDANSLANAATQSLASANMLGVYDPMMAAFAHFGGNTNNLNTESTSGFLDRIADLLLHIEKTYGQKQALIAAAAMHIPESMFFAMRHGSKFFEAKEARYAARSGASARSAAAAQRLREQWIEMTDQLNQVGIELVNSLMPEIKASVKGIENLAAWIHSHQKQINQFFTTAAKDVEWLAHKINDLAKEMGGWKNVLIGLVALKVISWLLPFVAAFKGLAALAGGPVSAAILAIVSLLGALTWFYHENPTFKNMVDTGASMVKTGWDWLVDKNNQVAERMHDKFDGAMNWMFWTFMGPKSQAAPIVDVAHAYGPPPGPLNAANMAKNAAQHSTASTVNHNTASVHVGSVTVNTSATNAPGIAGAIKHEFHRLLPEQVNYGTR